MKQKCHKGNVFDICGSSALFVLWFGGDGKKKATLEYEPASLDKRTSER